MDTIKESSWRKLQFVISGFIFFSIFALGIFHSMKGGINLTDEGLYFSAPYHYRFGVIPFKEAIHNATRQYDLLMAPIFILFPNITVLQFRIFGILLHISGIVAVFFLFSRFAPPLLVAALGAIFFLVNNFAGTPTPSYNLLVTTFGLWAFVLWMFGLLAKQSFRKRVLCLLSGMFLSFTIVSNMSAGVLLLVPLISSIFFWLKGRRQEAISTIIILAIVGVIFLLVGILMLTTGVWPYFWEALQNDAVSSNLALGGVMAKISRSWEGVMSVALHSLYLTYITVVIGLISSWVIGRAKGTSRFLLIILSLTVILTLLFPIIKFPAFDFVLVILSILCFPTIFIHLQKSEENERMILILAVLWSLVQVLSFGVLSTNALQSTVKGAFLLFLVAMLSTYKLYDYVPINSQNERLKKLFVLCMMSLIVGFFAIRGVDLYLNTNYLEVNYKKLTGIFSHPKLAGIYSVPEKIKPLEELLDYLKPRLKKNDYLLAYSDLPILYYLTDTQPLYPNVWSFETWWPLPYRKKLLQKMLEKQKKAEYAVHMVTNPGYGWGTPIAEGKSFDLQEPGECILCRYVEDNYVLEKFIFPFEVWRFGRGEKFEFLKNYTSYYDENFASFMGNDQELMHGKLVQMPPFWLDAVHGRYSMQTRKENGENIVRFVFNGVSSVYPSNFDISYYSERVGFNFAPTLGEEVALTAKVKLSSRRNVHPYYSALLYIQDKLSYIDQKTYITPEENSQGYPPLVEKDSLYWQTNSVAIQWPEWHQYAVTRKIRDGATHLNFGVTWVPMSPGDWIEIKNMRFYTSDKNKAEKFVKEFSVIKK